MGYYSRIEEIEAKFNITKSTFPKKNWDEFLEKMKDSFLTHGLRWGVSVSTQDDAVYWIDVDESEEGKAYELEKEFSELQKFMNQNEVEFELSFILVGDSYLDVQKYTVNNKTAFKSKIIPTFGEPEAI